MSKNINAQDILRKQIREYLIENGIERGHANCYKDVADKFGVNAEYIRDQYRRLRKKGLVETDGKIEISVKEEGKEKTYHFKQTGDDRTFDFVTNKQIKTLPQLLEACEMDPNEWTVSTWEVTKWEVGRKDKKVTWESTEGRGTGVINDTGKIHVQELWRVNAKFKARKIDSDLGLQKEILIEELKAYSPNASNWDTLRQIRDKANHFETNLPDCAMEINIPDLHIGKLAWAPETGESYDFKIAVDRYKSAVAELIGRCNVNKIEKFILVVGHDFFNSDGESNLTTAGTPQHNDVRFHKMIQIGKRLLIETIDDLSGICDVDVMVVPGNHDTNTMLMMGDILEAHYRNCEFVKIFTDPAPRKIYQYGNTGIMYCHGHNEKIADLGMIFATQFKHVWADTDFHRVHIGHFHHSKQLKYKDIQENIGCVVKIMNSLSSNDAWHQKKGFLSQKGAEAFLYHRTKGLLANYYYQV